MVGMADTAMVSGVGESAVAAVSLVNVLNLFLVQMFSAMSAGGAIVASQYLGSGDHENASASGHQLFLFVSMMSLSLGAVIMLFHRPIIGLMDSGSDPVLFEQACIYLLITAASYPFLGMYNAGISLQRAMGNTKTSMQVSLIINIINICGNYIFINLCKIGVAGAALATLIARMVAALVITRMMFEKHLPIHYIPLREKGFFHLNPPMIKRIFRLGVPNGVENSLFQLGRLMVTGLVATFSTPLRAAHGVCNSVTPFAFLPNTAISLATPAIIGRLIGAGKKEEAWYYGKKLLRWLYISLFPTNLCLVLFAEPLAGMFNLSAEAIPVAAGILRMFGALSIIMYGPAFGLANVLRASGDVRITMVFSIISMVVMRLGASYLLVYAFDLSLWGVWIAMHLDWLLRAVFFLSRFLSKKWLHKKAI